VRKSKFVTSVLTAAGLLALVACGGAGVQENAQSDDAELSIATANVIRITPLSTVTFPTVPGPGQWFFADESSSGGTSSGSFMNGPSSPPSGTGSVKLTVNAPGRILIGTTKYTGTKLSDIQVLRYSSYNQTSSTVITPALQFGYDADLTDGDVSFQGRLVYEPYNAGLTVLTGVWQTWNTLQGKWWASRGPVAAAAPVGAGCPISNPCTLQTILNKFPNLGIHTNPGFGILMLRLGGAGVPFTAYIDRLVIRKVGEVENTVYNFELFCGKCSANPE
jgi:hypothetical protein